MGKQWYLSFSKLWVNDATWVRFVRLIDEVLHDIERGPSAVTTFGLVHS